MGFRRSLVRIQSPRHRKASRDKEFRLAFFHVSGMPPTLKYEPGVIVADGDFVIVHGRFAGFGATANRIAADILGSRMVSLSNTGTSSRTRRRNSSPRAAGRCSATRFRSF